MITSQLDNFNFYYLGHHIAFWPFTAALYGGPAASAVAEQLALKPVWHRGHEHRRAAVDGADEPGPRGPGRQLPRHLPGAEKVVRRSQRNNEAPSPLDRDALGPAIQKQTLRD